MQIHFIDDMLFEMMGNWGNWWNTMMGGGWSSMMGTWAWPFAIAGGAFFIIAALVGIFWLWMLIDCLGRPDRDFPARGAYDKLVWIIVLLFANILGAILYYLMVKAKK